MHVSIFRLPLTINNIKQQDKVFWLLMAQLQHYVPKFVLRRFGTGKKDRIHVYDKQSDATWAKAAGKIAATFDMYDFTFMDAPMTVEPLLGKVESRAGEHIARIIAEESLNLLDPVERGEIAAFLAIQMVRTPAQSASLRDLKNRVKGYLEANGAPADFFAPDEKVGDGENAERAYMARSIVNAPKDYGEALINKDWVLLKTDRKHPYLIGDHPLTMNNSIDKWPRGNLGLTVEGIELYFPLSPTLALALWCPSHQTTLIEGIERLRRSKISRAQFHDLSHSATRIVEAIQTGKAMQSIPENVTFFNSLQLAFAERFVFSSDGDFGLVKELIKSNPDLRIGRRMQEGTGKF